MDSLIPPPIRRITVDRAPTTVAAPPAAAAGGNGRQGNGHGAPGLIGGSRHAQRAGKPGVERMRTEDLSIYYGEKLAVSRVSLPVRQGEILALIGPARPPCFAC